MLEKKSTRKAFERVGSDTASLCVHRDAASILSHYTDKLSKLSVVFSFDDQLLISRVYAKVVRGSLKEAIRKKNRSDEDEFVQLESIDQDWSITELENRKRSQRIDSRLRKDARQFLRQVNVLLIGSASSGKDEVLNRMKIYNQGAITPEEQQSYRLCVYQNVLDYAQSLVKAMDQFKIEPQLELNKTHRDYVREYSFDPSLDIPLDRNVGQAIKAIWMDPCMEQVNSHTDGFYTSTSAF